MKHSNNKLAEVILKYPFYLQIRTLYCLLLITFLTPSFCFSQKTKEYFDEDWKKTSEKNATYYRIGSKDENEKWDGPFKDFYINGEVQNEGTFSEGSKEGSFIFYYPDGKLKSKGEYKKNIPVGKWQSWYTNGRLKEDYFYVDTDNKNIISTNERIRCENFYDSLGAQLVKEGTGEYYSFYDNNKIEAQGHFNNYRREGEWKGFNEDGTLHFNEEYKEGKFLSGTSWDKNDKSYSYTQIEKMPEFPGGQEGLMKFLSRNMRYPEAAQRANVQGVVYLSFIIEKDGSIEDIQVKKGIGAGCEEEAIRVLRLSPPWKPGVQRGQNVKVKFTLPFSYRLGRR